MRAGSAFFPCRAVLDIAGVAPGQRVVDVGVGRTGHMVFSLAERVGAQGNVVGVDIAHDVLHMLEGIRRQYLLHHVDFLWMDVEGELDVPLADIDGVFVINTAWMFRAPAQTLARLARMLGATGKLVVVDWLPHEPHALAPRWDFRLHPEKLDVTLAHLGLRAVTRAQVTPWHFVRVYMPF